MISKNLSTGGAGTRRVRDGDGLSGSPVDIRVLLAASRGAALTKYASLELDSLVSLVSLDGVVGQQRGDGDLGLGRGGQDGGQPGDRG
jgi:hypothetical protein